MDWKDLLIHAQEQKAQIAGSATDEKGEPVVERLPGKMAKLGTVDMRIGILYDLRRLFISMFDMNKK
jgi:hypothetical protein